MLFGTFARRTRSDDYPWHLTREELVAAADRTAAVWGTEQTTALDSFSPGADAALRRWWIARDRAGATPGAVLPTLAFVGLVTFERAVQSTMDDHFLARRIALPRGYYLDNAPE